MNQDVRVKKNRLQYEKSPYLLQHAGNPVDWYAWCDEAFEKARLESKPVFLSIGYSTCHWCHVMAHESFEDDEVARLMNDAFVCIKVDREERPDVDGVYMTVCQMMTGGGGWPLTIVMTPDKRPFFAATYIPKDSRFGRMGMLQIIPKIKELWTSKQGEVLQSANQISAAVSEASPSGAGEALDAGVLNAALQQLAHRFDDRMGGFGDAPKFPTPHNLTLLLRGWKRSGNETPLAMVEKTLQAMRRGGIWDHVGFGFHRYSTDRHWLVPHFEKMLYDQALLAIAYLETYQATGNDEYAETAREILAYVLGGMTSPEGGFYCAEDADSEGVEGKFYVWTEAEVRQVLDKDAADLAIRAYNITKEGNYADEATGHRTGTNIPHLTQPIAQLAAELGLDEPKLRKRLETARQALFEHRAHRVHPHKDDKILTDWNGLMIAALARGAQVLDDGRYAEAADRAADFVLKTLGTPEGRLLHRFRDGHAGLAAHLDDYAFVVWGLLELYEATFDTRRLRSAVELTDDMLERFWDETSGGLFFTADDAEKLLVRQKDVYDGAIPSGNAVAMLNLPRLARITGNTDYERRAEQIGRAFSKTVRQAPAGHTHLITALDFAVGPTHEIVIAGDPSADDTKAMLGALRRRFIPNKVVLLRRPSGTDGDEIVKIAPWLEGHTAIDGKSTAYVCTDHQCKLPTTAVDKMLEMLQ
ncbi:MAG: thioredoxin domain-containing protein [Phycisphaerae bacterium]|nr:thioredoxin domain-containing protein [Phycisphaerae bacterium]